MRTIITYEIIETIPSVLKSKIPVIYYLKSLIYILFLLLENIKRIIKAEKIKLAIKRFFSNRYKIKGQDLEQEIILIDPFSEDIITQERKDPVLSTEVHFYSGKKARDILKKLKEQKRISKTYGRYTMIKEKIEEIESPNNKTDIIIGVATPIIATKIDNFFKLMRRKK